VTLPEPAPLRSHGTEVEVGRYGPGGALLPQHENTPPFTGTSCQAARISWPHRLTGRHNNEDDVDGIEEGGDGRGKVSGGRVDQGEAGEISTHLG
jgi:hypothetical protein